VLLLPAFADIGTARLLADGGELMLAHQFARRGVARRSRRLGAYPGGADGLGVIRPVSLLGMARARVGFEEAENTGHGALYIMVRVA
jgi:hypothetical protein